MDSFPPNSHKARGQDEPKRVKPVTTAEQAPRKRGLGRQFRKTFISGDGRSVIEYVIEDVFVPTIQEMFIDAVQGGIERLVRGEGPRSRRFPSSSPNNGYRPNISYDAISRPTTATRTTQPRSISNRARARNQFHELIIPTQREATEVIDQMYDILNRYGQVSVADLYALTDVRVEHTDEKWGWTSLRGARAVRTRAGGFLLDLPEPEPFQ